MPVAESRNKVDPHIPSNALVCKRIIVLCEYLRATIGGRRRSETVSTFATEDLTLSRYVCLQQCCQWRLTQRTLVDRRST